MPPGLASPRAGMPRTCKECRKKFYWDYFQGCANRACPLFAPEYAAYMDAYDRRRALMEVGTASASTAFPGLTSGSAVGSAAPAAPAPGEIAADRPQAVPLKRPPSWPANEVTAKSKPPPPALPGNLGPVVPHQAPEQRDDDLYSASDSDMFDFDGPDLPPQVFSPQLAQEVGVQNKEASGSKRPRVYVSHTQNAAGRPRANISIVCTTPCAIRMHIDTP